MRLAVVGKGGAGKSFITGTLARILARQGRTVLVLDSDPMPGVAVSLGMGPITDEMLAEAVEKGEDDRWRLKKGIGPVRAISRFSRVGPDGVRLLQYGKSTAAGLGPLMGSLNGFTRVVHRLATDGVLDEWTIIGDLPAGPRQTAFNWAPYADRYLVVCEPTAQSMLTATRVMRMAARRTETPSAVIANKVRDPADVDLISERLQSEVAATVPWDESVLRADRRGVAPIDEEPGAAAIGAVEKLALVLGRSTAGRFRGNRRVGSGGRP